MRSFLKNNRVFLGICVFSAAAAAMPIGLTIWQQRQLQVSIAEINKVYAVAAGAREVLDVVSHSLPSFTASALDLTEAERDQILGETDKYLDRLGQCVEKLMKSATHHMQRDELDKIGRSVEQIGHSWEEIRRANSVELREAEKTYHFLQIFHELRETRTLLSGLEARANKTTKATIAGAFDQTKNSQNLLLISLISSGIVSLGAITNISRFARATRAFNMRLGAAISNMGLGLCMFDSQQRLVVANDRYAALYGLEPERLTPGTSLSEIFQQRDLNDAFKGQDHEAYISECMAAAEKRGSSTVIQKLGDGRFIEIAYRPLADGGWLATHDDVTDRVETEQEDRRHRKQLEALVSEATVELQCKAQDLEKALAAQQQINDLQRQFVSMASHEFRTPLSIIDTVAQGLVRRFERLTPEEAGERIGKIRGAVKRMVRLVESTLMAARLDNGKVLIEIEDCDIAAIVREVCERQKEMTATHRISCTCRDLPATIRADQGALDQILTNLLSNAVTYSPDASEIDVVARALGEQIVISVSDRGLGIDEDDLQHLFKRFFRARNSAGIAGTGIGLNLCLTLVQMHGGSITVESKKGEGSTFTVRLPVSGPLQHEKLRQQAA